MPSVERGKDKKHPAEEPARENVPEDATPILTAASTFTSLWALTWLGVSAVGASAAVQGGFAVGSVMGASGLTALWWNTRALRHLQRESNVAEAQHEAAHEGDAEDEAFPPESTAVH